MSEKKVIDCDCPVCIVKKALFDNDIDTDFMLIFPDPDNLKSNMVTGTIPKEESWVRLGHIRDQIKEKLLDEGTVEAIKATTH